VDGPGFESQYFQEIFITSESSRPAVEPTQLSIQWIPGLKRPECEANHLRPSSAKVKDWKLTCFPHMCLYRVERENFTFTFVNNWELRD